jgi:hypothetical protein
MTKTRGTPPIRPASEGWESTVTAPASGRRRKRTGATPRRGLALLLALAAMAPLAGPASAQVYESHAWQFDTNVDRSVKANQADLIERQKHGYYTQWQVTNVYNQTSNTYFAGGQTNCSQQAVATGSSASNGLTSTVGSNVVTSTPSISSGTTANSGTNTGNTGSSGSTGVTSNQSTSGSSLSSSVSGSSSSTHVHGASTDGGKARQALNNSQSLMYRSTDLRHRP